VNDVTAKAVRASEVRSQLITEISKVYIGAEATIEILLVALLGKGHVLLEGVPGIAKTTLVKAFAQTLGCDFKRIQFTPDLLPADITGTYILDLKTNAFDLRKGPLFGNIVLGDEINRAPAKTQSALLEAMQETQVTIDGETHALTSPFMVLATQNPVEHEGVFMLPEAQLDRFMFRVELGYPTYEQERELLRTYNQPLPEIKAVLDPADILSLGDVGNSVFIDEELMDYVVQLVAFTRGHSKVMLGGSPRATLALMQSAKQLALIRGRDYVTPADIRYLAPYLLNHRLVLTPEAELEGTKAALVVDWALESVPYTQKASGI